MALYVIWRFRGLYLSVEARSKCTYPRQTPRVKGYRTDPLATSLPAVQLGKRNSLVYPEVHIQVNQRVRLESRSSGCLIP